MRRRDPFVTVRTQGSILPPDLLARIADGDKDLGGLSLDDYHLSGERLNEAINRAWNVLCGAWAAFREARAALPAEEAGTGITRERWLLPLFRELDYGRLEPAKAITINGKSYAISHMWRQVPIHLVGVGVDLDRRAAGVAGAARTSPHGLVQEFLNCSDEHLWGFVSNGLRLRILRDNRSLTRPAYVEFDIEAMMEEEVYSDFVLLWLLCHQSRVEAPRPEECWLERWSRTAQEQGTRALDRLRSGVEEAIRALGRGFLAHPANQKLREALASGELSKQHFYQELLRLVYRLIFLFVAEDRGLLFAPDADAKTKEVYLTYFSTARLRRLAEKRRGTRHHDLYQAFCFVVERLGSDEGCPELGLPPLGGYLFSNEATPHLNASEQARHNGCASQLANADFLAAVRALAFTTEGGSRRPVDYRNLGSEELGSIYESLLELHPDIDTGSARFELSVVAGSERKSTGSYYTPTSLIQCLLDSALDPVIAEALRRPDPEQALLDLKVCDPACGSGHFLVAAAHRIAKRLAALRTGDEEPSPEALREALRAVIGRCLYGVDVNPMAVELCKVSLWMEALEPGKPLSFLEHRILCGNSLLGATPALLADGIPDEAFKPIEGDDKEYVTTLRRRNRQERTGGQMSFLAGDLPSVTYRTLADAALELAQAPDDSVAALHEKEAWYELLSGSPELAHARLAADAWCAAFVSKKRKDAPPPVTHDLFLRLTRDPSAAPAEVRVEIARLAEQYRFFHWHLAFPDVFRLPTSGAEPENAQAGWDGGFDVVLGNPPFANVIEGIISDRTKAAKRCVHPDLGGTADQAFQFLSLSSLIVRNTGLVALVQPRSVLNAPACERLRCVLGRRLPPRKVFVAKRSDLFHGAAVFICLLCLGRGGDQVLVSIDDEPDGAAWQSVTLSTANWWSEIVAAHEKLAVRAGRAAVSLGDRFEVAASMTAADAYDLVPHVVDQRDGSGLKLVTTGLIDPGMCLWGRVACRYLRKDFLHPRVPMVGSSMTASIRRRLQQSHRPKILVAGLSKRIECFLDRSGEFVGAVSTFSIYHPEDDVAALEELCDTLLSEDASVRFRLELGGNAMGGGNITMKKHFLESFPLEKGV